MNLQDIPIFIICRDKVTDLKVLVQWFKDRQFNTIYLVDNDSTHPPLLFR